MPLPRHSLGRTTQALAAVVVLAGALLGVAARPASVLAADAVTVDVHPLMDGRFQPGGWLALDVTVTNSGPPVEAYVTANSETGTVRRFVELPAGARKSVPLYVKPQPFARQVRVQVLDGAGAPLGAGLADVDALDSSGGHIAIVGDETGNLRPQFLLAGEAESADRVISVTAADLPTRPEPLEAVGTLVWAADGADVTENQRRSVERWVANGGTLIVLGGAEWQARSGPWTDVLPVTGMATEDDVSIAALAEWAGVEAPAASGATVSTGELVTGATTLVPLPTDAGALEGSPLISARNHGGGRVTFVGADLATDSFGEWEGARALWTRLVPDTSIIEEFFGMPVDANGFSFVNALGSITALGIPPVEVVLLVIVGYIILIGPVNYIVLRRLDRREMAWVTAPLLVIVFSVASYGIGSATKGSNIIVNEIAVIRTAPGASSASVESYAGIFSPNRASYDLSVRNDALIAALGAGNQFDPQTGNPLVPRAAVEQGDPARLRHLEVGVFGLQAVRADAVVPYEPSLEVSWHVTEDGIEGTVRNVSSVPLEDVSIIHTNAEMVGDLDAGASAEFTVSGSNFSGEPASQQLYGFEDFGDPSVTDERLRRQVIDAMVPQGFVEFGMGGAVAPGSGGTGGGPMVLAWSGAASPVPFEVDGHGVERRSQTVEVLTGRPEYRPGPTELAPGQLTSTVISHEGDATTDIPGGISLGVGSVEFRIALPLELAALEPTALEIIVGSDPGMVFASDQFGGGGQGFFPAGYVLSVQDVVSREWVELGDLATDLSFDVDDAARYVDNTGQIRVQIVRGEEAVGPDERVVIFVGAGIEGVLP